MCKRQQDFKSTQLKKQGKQTPKIIFKKFKMHTQKNLMQGRAEYI